MSKNNDGGPAFPQHPALSGDAGMSLRDWFAGMAMGLGTPSRASMDYGDTAAKAYRIADAMLKERLK